MIRLAENEDLDAILKIYETARESMRNQGNPNQWGGQYPPKELVIRDMEAEHLYVIQQKEEPRGVFALVLGEDETYEVIEDGCWKNGEPYGTIHRLAGDGRMRGIFESCLKFCRQEIGNLRADTHEDNHVMQHLLEKHGFEKCGIIHVADGSPRIAYQWCENSGKRSPFG